MNAQTAGKITGSDSNEPLIGASVVIKGTTNGTVTDVDGSFSVNAKSGDSLQVSFLGYTSQTIAVDNTNKSTLQDWINNYYGSNSEAVRISATYVKLREVTLTYNFPREIFKNTFVKGLNVSFVGRNLLYWAERTDIDIDQFSGFFGANGGRSSLQTPTTRRFGVNVNVNF